jgi:hypothetical protein
MKKACLTILLVASVAAFGCGDDEEGVGGEGGNGGAGGEGGNGGGMIGPLTWTGTNLSIVADDCVFFDETLVETFVMNIDGSEVTLEIPETEFLVTTDDYAPTDDIVVLMGSATNNDFAPCEVELNDDFTIELDDTSVSLDQNDTVSVSWFHDEDDLSGGACDGVWFADLPCTGEATLTLIQQ